MNTAKEVKKPRVILEPALEKIAGTWGPEHRLLVADTWERWIRELRISAYVTLSDRGRPAPKPKLRRLTHRQLLAN